MQSKICPFRNEGVEPSLGGSKPHVLPIHYFLCENPGSLPGAIACKAIVLFKLFSHKTLALFLSVHKFAICCFVQTIKLRGDEVKC